MLVGSNRSSPRSQQKTSQQADGVDSGSPRGAFARIVTRLRGFGGRQRRRGGGGEGAQRCRELLACQCGCPAVVKRSMAEISSGCRLPKRAKLGLSASIKHGASAKYAALHRQGPPLTCIFNLANCLSGNCFSVQSSAGGGWGGK